MRKPWAHQRQAVDRLSNGSVLVGGTGSGKSFAALVYYYEKVLGGSIDPPRLPSNRIDLYVITTAMKRDRLDWDKEATAIAISKHIDVGLPEINFTVDSWNNIKKYKDIRGAFFIFDEQKTLSYGAWSRTFIRIAKRNRWVLLTATPADRWIDLMSVFIANGLYKNKTAFVNEHVHYAPYVKYPVIRSYLNVPKLRRHKERLFVYMTDSRTREAHDHHIFVEYDKEAVNRLLKTEWNPFTDQPIRNLAEHVHCMRRIINSDPSRLKETRKIFELGHRLIVFYNFNFELELLRDLFSDTIVAEHNGHKHDPLPEGDRWVYLVQYLSGNEAWECFTTNRMLFFSLNYSHRITKQAKGRIDRNNTTFSDLHYYILLSKSQLDLAILRAQKQKRKFNEKELKIRSYQNDVSNG